MDKETFKEMNYLPKNLTFDEGVGFINDFSLIVIASEHGTPLYVYDWNHIENNISCLLYTSPSPRDLSTYRMPSSA